MLCIFLATEIRNSVYLCICGIFSVAVRSRGLHLVSWHRQFSSSFERIINPPLVMAFAQVTNRQVIYLLRWYGYNVYPE